jgi:hypothetical protein
MWSTIWHRASRRVIHLSGRHPAATEVIVFLLLISDPGSVLVPKLVVFIRRLRGRIV